MSKETFIIRSEWQDAIFELQQIERAIIFENLFHFHNGNENLINLNNLSVKLVWKLIEPNLKRNITAYDKRKETSAENGRLGGRPVKKTENENNLNNLNLKPNETKKPNETLSVSDNVSDSVSVSDNVSDSDLPRKRFSPPSYDEVLIFMKEKNSLAGNVWDLGKVTAEAKNFWNYYEANGWMVGRNKMKKWDAACRKWMNNANNYNKNINGKQQQQSELDAYRAHNQEILRGAIGQ